MQWQRCPNCREKNDVSFYVHGQQARCTRCGLRFRVDHEDLSNPNAKQTPKVGEPTEATTHVSTPDKPAEELVVSSPELPSELPKPPPHPPISTGQLFPTPVQRQNVPPKQDPPPAATPPIIPGYDMLELLGRGGMGEVWRARQHSLNRLVAVKILAPTLAVEPDFVRRFERESSALAAIAHQNIVTVYDRGSANGWWYFVMEFVEGRSLRDRMEARLPRNDLLKIFVQVAKAVDYAHKRGVIHRDLKPENVLLDHAGQAKVADFGLAGMSEVGRSSLTMTAVAMGTAHYMAPEQRRDAKNVDGRADIYSLGVMLYELLCREIPAGKFATPKERYPDLDPRLDALVMQMLDQDPERRPAKASDVVEVIEQVLAPPPPAPPAPVEIIRQAPPTPVVVQKPALASLVKRVQQSPSQRYMLYGAGGLLALVLVVTVARGSGSRVLAADVKRNEDTQVATVTFGAGAPDAVVADGSGWSVQKGSLVRAASASGEPRAWLQRAPVDFERAAIEAEVQLSSAGTAKEPAYAELAIVKDEFQLSLRISAGEDLVPSLAYAAKGKQTRQEGTREPFQANHTYKLKLWVMNGTATALLDGHTVGSTSASALTSLHEAKVGFGCLVGQCSFSTVKVKAIASDVTARATVKNE